MTAAKSQEFDPISVINRHQEALECLFSIVEIFFSIANHGHLFFIVQSMLVFFNPIKFGITFTFGNLLAIGRYSLIISFVCFIISCYSCMMLLPIPSIVVCLHIYFDELFSWLDGQLKCFSSKLKLELRSLQESDQNLCSILCGSTAFLIGPKRQVTMMLDPVRIYATAVYLASMIIALFCALYVSIYLSNFFVAHIFVSVVIYYFYLITLDRFITSY